MDNFVRIKPGDPDYQKPASADALGEKPASLVTGLHFVEDELARLRKMKAEGRTELPPELPDGSDEEAGVKSLDERIAELEKMLSGFEKAIAWAEAKRPGSSEHENGSLLIAEYEKETGETF